MKLILHKGRRLPEGSIRTWRDGIKRKKTNGKWVPLKKPKMEMTARDFAESLMNKVIRLPGVDIAFESKYLSSVTPEERKKDMEETKEIYRYGMVKIYADMIQYHKLKREDLLKRFKEFPEGLLLDPRQWSEKGVNYLKKLTNKYDLNFMAIIHYLNNSGVVEKDIISEERREHFLNLTCHEPLMGYTFEQLFAETIKRRNSYISTTLHELLEENYNYDSDYVYHFSDEKHSYENWGEAKQLDTLKNGKIVKMYRNPSKGVNGSYIVTLENSKGEQLEAIFKPGNSESEGLRVGIPDKTQYKREVACYEISKATGLGLIPPTVLRYDGSIQMILGGTDEAARIDEHDRQTQTDVKELERGALLDFLLFNTDRHTGNYLFFKSSDSKLKMSLVDNGLTMPGEWYSFKSRIYKDFIYQRYIAEKEAGTPDASLYKLESNPVELDNKMLKSTISKLSPDKLNKLGLRLFKDIGLDKDSILGFVTRFKYVMRTSNIPAYDTLQKVEKVESLMNAHRRW